MNRVAAVVAAVLVVGTACGDVEITTVDSGALLSLAAHDPAPAVAPPARTMLDTPAAGSTRH